MLEFTLEGLWIVELDVFLKTVSCNPQQLIGSPSNIELVSEILEGIVGKMHIDWIHQLGRQTTSQRAGLIGSVEFRLAAEQASQAVLIGFMFEFEVVQRVYQDDGGAVGLETFDRRFLSLLE